MRLEYKIINMNSEIIKNLFPKIKAHDKPFSKKGFNNN